jgi:hypothetical protein
MSHITHFKKQPVNVQYWDYYILCRLNTDATIALQRMEYWDGTKEDGNVHAENINDALIQQGQEPTQDTGNWVYKSGDELHWELMGVTGERRLPKLLNFLIDEVGYLAERNNPINTWDRKKQYCFQRRLIQQHINYLSYIIDYFDLPMARLTPVFYAIERLTADKCYIDKINAEKVLAMIEKMKGDEKLPHFLKHELVKFSQTFSNPGFIPFRNFAEWKAQICGMHSAKTQNRSRKTADSIPQKRGSNSIEDKTYETNIDHKHNKGGKGKHSQPPTPVASTPPDAPVKTFFESLTQEHFETHESIIMPKAGTPEHAVFIKLEERAKSAPAQVEAEMRRVYLSLYNKQDTSGEYWWRDLNRLTFCAFLRGYNKQLDALNKPTPSRSSTPKSSSPGLHRASNGFCTPEYVRKLATMTPEQRKAEAKAKKEARLAQQQEQQNV